MAQITLTIADALIPRIAASFGYNAAKDGPVAPFLKAQLRAVLQQRVGTIEANVAMETAKDAAMAKARTEIDVT